MALALKASSSSRCSLARTARVQGPLVRSAVLPFRSGGRRVGFTTVVASADPSTDPSTKEDAEIENLDSEAARKKAEADRLRAAEKFMVIGSGTAACKGCGYEYSPERGDPDFPVARGTLFQDLPEDYVCPICGAPKSRFESRVKVVAGFAENQKYGLGTNSMTGGQKLLLIYGALAVFFILFLSGYALD